MGDRADAEIEHVGFRKRILLVEDDSTLTRVLTDTLDGEGFDTRSAATCADALALTAKFRPDLVLLDVMLPDGNGLDLLRQLNTMCGAPVIVLTARGQKADKLRGLNLGADDYVTKPFDLDELLARVNVVLRRVLSVGRVSLGSLTVDFKKHEASRNGRAVHLTAKEFGLLMYLAERRERAVYRDELLREVWRYPDDPLTRSVDHAVARLRKKIEPDPHHPRFLLTVHGDGYRLIVG